jgi:hypothetical protein
VDSGAGPCLRLFDASFIKKAPEGGFESYYVSCDYGTLNPAIVRFIGKKRRDWYRIREFYFDSRREGFQKRTPNMRTISYRSLKEPKYRGSGYTLPQQAL